MHWKLIMSLRMSMVLFFLMWCTNSVQVVSGQSDHESHKHGSSKSRLHPFEEISQASFLSVQKFSTFIDSLFDNFVCGGQDHDQHENDSSDEECGETLCLNVEDLIELVGGNSTEGITEDQFGNASIILLYLATDLDHHCHEKVNVSLLSVEQASSRLLDLTYASSPDHPHIHTAGIIALLDTFKASINHEDHDHNGEGSHDSNHRDASSDHDHNHEDGDHHDEDGDHHDEDGDHHDEDGDHHDEDGDHHDEDGDHHDEDGDHHDEDGDHHDHDHDHVRLELVVQARCLAADALLYYMGAEISDFIESDQLGQLASITVYLLAEGSDVQESCRNLPQQSGFFQHLFAQFDGNSSHLSIGGFEEMMTSLGINPEADNHGGDHAGHDHRRKRRSTNTWSDVLESKGSPLSRRFRRQASGMNPFTQCYSAEQLAALYDTASYMDQSVFQQLCPSLISQRLYGDCGSETTKSDISDGEKYGYSSLAVFIICLCSILGVVLIPCASHRIYDTVMALFLGLAVGTLFADAILHLIPSAFGVHGHEDGHDHGSEIVVEEFARYGLVIMAALYFFYIIELVLSACGGHSHGDENIHTFNHNDHEHVNTITMNTMNGDQEKGKKYQVTSSEVKSNGHATSSQLDTQSRGFLGIPPIAVMIVIGDAIHNCADGLVIGTSFSQGQISSGIATSIAVFCHELPHELGDFAVLVESGCSFGKAVFLNLLSSLTAFIGLYIGLSISTDSTTERWILAIASGMFIYIALVDLLPQLVKTRGLKVVLHNIGILVGFAIMIVLVVFEEHIEV